MNIKHSLFFAAVLLMQYGCGHKKASDPLADSGRTQRTENLLLNLDSIAERGYLCGQQDATLYGIGWEGDSARSDIHTISNEHPAIAAFEVGGIERLQSSEIAALGNTEEAVDTISGISYSTSPRNILGARFTTIKKRILEQYDRSGVCVLTWHMASRPTWTQIDRLCDFLNSLDEPYGVRVPVILRPCTPCQNLNFWQRLTERLKAKNVTNALLACDANAFTSDMASYIDILGIADCQLYGTADTAAAYAKRLDTELSRLTALGKQYQKPVGILACGQQGLRTEHWFTTVLLPVLDHHRLSFVLFARNDNSRPGNFYVPFPGQQNVSDFVTFVNAQPTLFLHDINGIYLSKDDGK